MPQRDRPDPIKDYIEWTGHRLDPGYYLGGRLPPWLRAREDRRDSDGKKLPPRPRRLGLVYLVTGILSLLAAAAAFVSGHRDPGWLRVSDALMSLALVALFIMAGWRILRG